MEKIKVVVNGACGKMGKETIKAINKDPELKIVGAVDIIGENNDAGEISGIGKIGITISQNLKETLINTKPDVLVDFTTPKVIMSSIKTAGETKTNIVVGTTGITENDLTEIEKICKKNGINVFIAPNFAIGAVLMMRFSSEAIKYMPKAEILEFHHDQKLDAPSGTSIKTSQMMKKISGKNVPIHSIRLPGFVAHQEVIFGGIGQTLSIRHDSISRESFMPGVILAIKKISQLNGLVYGLENIL